MTELTAIDILINPDDATLQRAHTLNTRMRQSVPDGFALDGTHQPHITTLQRFVRTAELDPGVRRRARHDRGYRLLDPHVRCRGAAPPRGWGAPGQALAAVVLTPSAAVLDYQARLLAAVTPFSASGGTAAAFVTDAADPDINQTTINWVEGYLGAQLGDKYIPHITVGLATVEDLTEIEASPFDAFEVHPVSVAVYHLGNNGTARTELHAWTLAGSNRPRT